MMTSGEKKVVAVIGAGSWGTALGLLLAAGGHETRLWDRTPPFAAILASDRENRRYLPGFPFPKNILPTAVAAVAVGGADCVVIAVPSHGVRSVLAEVAKRLKPGADIVLAAKGMDSSGLFPSEIATEILGDSFPITALSGPNLAVEVARGVPTAAVAASTDADATERIVDLFSRPAFRVYTGSDRMGVEIGGAVKNVLAIAAGVSDGLGYGDNTKAALLTRGLAEMARLGVASGANVETFYGLAGVGDLMATAASRLSRNWRVGEGIAKGEPLQTILARLGQVAEGVPTAKALVAVAEARGVEMPVCSVVASLLFTGESPIAAVAALLNRSRKGE
jgi:glycerol-3-phosphate dehydrogenase (NAD(P)+)